jgi:DNA primase catalytic subunit
MLDLGACLRHYKRPEIQRAMVDAARNREVSVRYLDEGFGKRPDALLNYSDVLEHVKKNASSFHCSEEHWSNPLQISTGMKKDDLDKLRKGWDLVLDIDCPYWELSKITTWLFIEALKSHGIKSISLKFSGNKGFHIGVPFKAFPSKVPGKDVLTKDYFPDGPRRIAQYLLYYVEKHLIRVEGNNEVVFGNKIRLSLEELQKLTGKHMQELTYKVVKKGSHEVRVKEVVKQKKFHYPCTCGHFEIKDDYLDFINCSRCKSIVRPMTEKAKMETDTSRRFNASGLIAVDTVLIAPRHLYRMIYSLHEKSGLVSIPVAIDRVLDFKKSEAMPASLKVSNLMFLDDSHTVQGEAEHLLKEAFDFNPAINVEEDENKIKKAFSSFSEEIQTKIPEELFPPCIKTMLLGMKDGKKRAVFMLINFLSSVGWNHDEIKERLMEWNKLNPEPLRENVIVTHVRYHKDQKKNILAPNCPERDNNIPIAHQQNHYTDLQVCHPVSLCSRIKNPVQYAKKRAWLVNQEVSKKKGRSSKNKGKTETGSSPVKPQ